MTDKLADETLAAILAESLLIPDAFFACTYSWTSPFAETMLSSSTILLVCKRWLRVATPLLYETVILRSAAQSSALAGVLKKHPAFGRYIRKLRVEGGVGVSVCKIFKASPNITELCLMLDLYAGDNAAPMYNSLLDSVAPRRLILSSAMINLNTNKQMTIAISALATCILQWTTLRVVTLVDIALCNPHLHRAVCNAAHLELIEIPQQRSFHYASHSGALARVAADSAAPVIRVGWPAMDRDTMAGPRDRRAELPLVLQAKIEFAAEPESHETVIAPPASSSYTPLANVPDATRRAIWSHIFEAVITYTSGIDFHRALSVLGRVDPFNDADAGGSDAEDRSHLIRTFPHGPVGQCMSVCKEWKEIITPLACRNLYLPTPAKVAKFLVWIAARTDTSELAAGVRSIRFNRISEPPKGDADELAALCDASFIGRFRNLEALRCDHFYLSPKALSTLPTARLRSLNIKSDCGEFTVPSFPSLRTLHWKLESSHAVVQPSTADFSPSMPRLETLVVSGDGAPKILRGLSNFRLPEIASIEFDDKVCNDESAIRAFCTTNGASIRRVINLGKSDMLSTLLPLCPGLTSLSISWVHLSNLIENVRQCTPHTSLEEITYAQLNVQPRYTKSKAHEATMILVSRFCDALEPAKFPALHTLRIPQYNIWPQTQHDILGHPLPVLAEKMLERGVRIVNSGDIGWKPRLTRGKRKPGT